MIVNNSPINFLDMFLTVNPLLVSKCVSLLSLVPLNDQTVTERESCSGISSAVKSVSPVNICSSNGIQRTTHRS
jgi:hypothetical protein